MKKTNPTKEQIDTIKRLYSVDKLSKRKINKITGFSTSLLDRILKNDLNIYQYKDNSQSTKRIKTPSKGSELVAICKKTKKIFKDFENKSGVITTHLKKIYPNIIIPSGFKRRDYKSKTGLFWFEEYVDIIEKKINHLITKKCYYCNWKTVDINNSSGAYEIHLKKKHNIGIEDHLKNNKCDNTYFSNFARKKKEIKKRNDGFAKKEEDYILCKICNKKLKSLTNTHLKKHKINLSEYKLKFPEEKYHSEKFIKKTKKNLKTANINAQRKYISKPEMEVGEFLENLLLEVEKNNRKFLNGVEIDLLIHKSKIGIEFNGCKYHTENFGGKNRHFHINKTNLMKKKGYSLIHIFEDEWELKNKIVKSKIKHILNVGSTTKRIHARKCVIKKINSKDKNDFLNLNHIQGEDKSNIHLGSFYENELVSVMTFDNKRNMNGKTNKNIYELKRFCSKTNYNIPGIAGRFLSFFRKNYNPSKIISFADLRWTLDANNNLYTKLGFVKTKILKPDYFYYNNKIHRLKRFHKFGFGKNSLKKKYPKTFNKNKTEWEIMQELGYDRIWDCGKIKYELETNS